MSYQNFYADWTEQDTPGVLSQEEGTPYRSTYTALNRTHDNTYLGRNFGAGHFTDFEHRCTIEVTDIVEGAATSYRAGLLAYTNALGDIMATRAGDSVFLISRSVATANKFQFVLYERVGASNYSDTSVECDVDTPYYLLTKKSGTSFKVGIYSTAELRNAGDATDGDVDNLALTLQGDYSFQYMMCPVSADYNTAKLSSGYIENLDLQEEEGVTVTPSTLSLILTKYIPTITISGNIVVTPSVLALALTKYVPTILLPKVVTPSTLALALTSYIPTVTVAVNIIVTPSTLGLILTSYVPSVLTPIVTTPSTLALALTSYIPSILQEMSISDTGEGSEALDLLINVLLREMFGIAEDVSIEYTLESVSETGEGVDIVTVEKEQSCKISSNVRPLYVLVSIIRGKYEIHSTIRGRYSISSSMRGG